MKHKILQFIWGGSYNSAKHRANKKILHLLQHKGGLGLVDLHTQTQALLVHVFLWDFQPGPHPLKHWI